MFVLSTTVGTLLVHMDMYSTIVDTNVYDLYHCGYSIVIDSTIVDIQGRKMSLLLWVHSEIAYFIINSNENGLY